MMKKFIAFFINKNIYVSMAIVAIGILVYELLREITDKLIKRDNQKISKKQKTYARLFRNILKYIIMTIVVVLVLQVNGINVTSIIAGLGLVSVIAGLALQDALKDIIMGFNIIIDDYFSVGDILKIDDTEGKVLELGLKRTKLKDINTGNILVISNRNISQVTNVSTQFDISIPLPYEKKAENIEEIIYVINRKITGVKDVMGVEYKGIEKFGDSAIYYKIRIFCQPELKPQIKREANRIIKITLDEANISIPYMQIDIHKK